MGQTLLRIAVWLGYGLSRVVMAQTVGSSDLMAFFERLRAGGALEEYGPLANAIILVPLQLAPGDPFRFLLGAKAIALVVDAAVMHGVFRRTPPVTALAFVVCSHLLGEVWLDRLDLYVGAILVAAVLGGQRVMPLFVAAAALIKFPFVALSAVGWLRTPSRSQLQAALISVAAMVACLAVASISMGNAGTFSPFAYHAGRTLQMEGLVGNLLYLGAGMWGWEYHVTVDHGAAHVHGAHDGMLSLVGQGVLLLGVAVTALRIRQRGETWSLRHALLLATVAYTAFNPVGSLQFGVVLVCLAPFCLPHDGKTAWLGWMGLALYALFARIAFGGYPTTAEPDVAFGTWTLMRNVALVGAWAFLMLAAPSEESAPGKWD